MSTVSCYVLDVGQGSAALVQGDSGAVLVDAGPSKTAVLDFLNAHGIQRLEAVFISHADADHLAGLVSLLSKVDTDPTFTVGHVYLNPDARDTAVWDDITFQLDRMDRLKILSFSAQLDSDVPSPPLDLGGCTVDVLAPSKYMRLRAIGGRHRSGGRLSANSMSAVVRISCGDEGWVLLPGDLDHIGLADAIDRNAWREAPVMVFPHHGGRAGTDAQTKRMAARIVEASKAEYVLFSGRSHTNKFPSPLVIDTLLGLFPLPKLLSIGHSPVLDERFAGLDQCLHRNATGTLRISTPDAQKAITIASYAPPGSVATLQ